MTIPLIIDKGIPVPAPLEHYARSGRPAKYDWSTLLVGDSTLVPSNSDARTAWAYGACNGKVFTSRRNSRGWRVWRVA